MERHGSSVAQTSLRLAADADQHHERGAAKEDKWIYPGRVEKIARLGGITEIRLELRSDNEQALVFYEQLGFRATKRHRGYYDGKQDAISMTCRLGRAPT